MDNNQRINSSLTVVPWLGYKGNPSSCKTVGRLI